MAISSFHARTAMGETLVTQLSAFCRIEVFGQLGHYMRPLDKNTPHIAVVTLDTTDVREHAISAHLIKRVEG